VSEGIRTPDTQDHNLVRAPTRLPFRDIAGLLYTARNYRLSRRGQVTDRFTTALERLGSSELYVRIGGVHALEHVMRDSADHHDVDRATDRERVPAGFCFA